MPSTPYPRKMNANGAQQPRICRRIEGFLQDDQLSILRIEECAHAMEHISSDVLKIPYWSQPQPQPQPQPQLQPQQQQQPQPFSHRNLKPKSPSRIRQVESNHDGLGLPLRDASFDLSLVDDVSAPKKETSLSVRFSHVTIREYEHVLDNGGQHCTDTSSIGSGSLQTDYPYCYQYKMKETIPVDEYEKERPKRRTRDELKSQQEPTHIPLRAILKSSRDSKRRKREKQQSRSAKPSTRRKILNLFSKLVKKSFNSKESCRHQSEKINISSTVKSQKHYQHYPR